LKQGRKIDTRCLICNSPLENDIIRSVFICPSCYNPNRMYTEWCPYCGSPELSKYGIGENQYKCDNCGEYYHIWDSSLILNDIIKRIDCIEQKLNQIRLK